MVRMPCKEHDALAASSQFVTHFTGRLLSKMNLKPSPIATAGFKALLKLVENTCSDSFDLFYALYAHNPASSEQLQTFEKAFSFSWSSADGLAIWSMDLPSGAGHDRHW